MILKRFLCSHQQAHDITGILVHAIGKLNSDVFVSESGCHPPGSLMITNAIGRLSKDGGSFEVVIEGRESTGPHVAHDGDQLYGFSELLSQIDSAITIR